MLTSPCFYLSNGFITLSIVTKSAELGTVSIDAVFNKAYRMSNSESLKKSKAPLCMTPSRTPVIDNNVT